MKDILKNIGDFNGWKGNILLYVNKKMLREIAKDLKQPFATLAEMNIKEVYKLYK